MADTLTNREKLAVQRLKTAIVREGRVRAKSGDHAQGYYDAQDDTDKAIVRLIRTVREEAAP